MTPITQDPRFLALLGKTASAPVKPAEPPMTKQAAETKLAAAGLDPVSTARIIGGLRAMAEFDMNTKEAAEYLGIPEDTVNAVIAVAK